MAVARWFGFNVPFLTQDSVLPPQYDERLIKNDILLLLLTRPEQRRGRPTFGTIITAYPFEQLDEQSLNDLRTNVKNALDTFEPRVKFKELKVAKDPSGTAVNVALLTTLVDVPTQVLTVNMQFPLVGA